MVHRHLRLAGLLCLVGLLVTPAMADHPSGTLDAVGSDTMAGLMLRWGERLARSHPGLRLQLQASGSASAPPALTAGTTRLGPMSRPMTEAERGAFVARYGYPPREVVVAKDALVVVAHRHNPLESLSSLELDAIFSKNRRCGGEQAITRWQQLGVSLPEGGIRLHGRNAASGTHGLFRRVALCGGHFRAEVSQHPGSAAVVAAVAEDPRALGYAGLNHLDAGVKVLARRDADGSLHWPDEAAVASGDYRLTRDLYLYVNLPPGESLPAPEQAFLELVLSPEGQAVVAALDFVALPPEVMAHQRDILGLASGGG